MLNRQSLLVALLCGLGVMSALEGAKSSQNAEAAPESAQAFTGQVKGNRVRLRLNADRDSAIIDELERGQLIAVVGSEDEFYEVLPPKGTRVYVFRTYILDNRIEGNRVNVRLQPALDAPVIAQLNHGDYVHGEISSLNNKWIEIPPPKIHAFMWPKNLLKMLGAPTTYQKWKSAGRGHASGQFCLRRSAS